MFDMLRSVGSPGGPRIGSDSRPGSSAWKIGSSGDGADEDAVRPDLPSSLLTPRTGRRPWARPVSRSTTREVTTGGWGGATGRAATRDSG